MVSEDEVEAIHELQQMQQALFIFPHGKRLFEVAERVFTTSVAKDSSTIGFDKRHERAVGMPGNSNEGNLHTAEVKDISFVYIRPTPQLHMY